ncbi:hypothetical protein VTO73DRAFT_45 [Trametes versicolor]
MRQSSDVGHARRTGSWNCPEARLRADCSDPVVLGNGSPDNPTAHAKTPACHCTVHTPGTRMAKGLNVWLAAPIELEPPHLGVHCHLDVHRKSRMLQYTPQLVHYSTWHVRLLMPRVIVRDTRDLSTRVSALLGKHVAAHRLGEHAHAISKRRDDACGHGVRTTSISQGCHSYDPLPSSAHAAYTALSDVDCTCRAEYKF